MRWQSIFTTPPTLSVAEAQKLLQEQSNETLQFIDVREKHEYESSHIPGAISIPLSQFERRFSEIDQTIKSIIYCRSGVRSKTACQFLRERDFDNVFNMAGGMLAWQGQQVQGGEERGFEYFLRKEYSSVYELSCNLEAGLRYFYQELAQHHRDSALVDLLQSMARFEDEHIDRLTAMHKEAYPEIELHIDSAFSEGGWSTKELLANFAFDIETPESLLQLAMSFEAQAIDLYSRLAKKVDDPIQVKFFTMMASEERQHIVMLAKKLEKLQTAD